jgi:hypothetical protein
MKGVFGILALAAGQTIYVSALAVPSLHERQVDSANTSSLNLQTIIGTLNVSATLDVTSTFTGTGVTLPTGLVTDNCTDTATDVILATSTPTGTVTLTVTDVEIITPSADPATTTTATDEFVTVSFNGGQFGGQVGQAIAESAPTAGAIVTIGGSNAFGGVVGVLQASPSTSTIFITATAVVTVIASPNNSTTDPAAVTDLAPTETPTQAAGAFGGIVGSQVFVSNLVSTASAFSGFGGIAGFVSASPETATSPATTATPTSTGGYYNKRAAFTTAINVTTSQTGIAFSPSHL